MSVSLSSENLSIVLYDLWSRCGQSQRRYKLAQLADAEDLPFPYADYAEYVKLLAQLDLVDLGQYQSRSKLQPSAIQRLRPYRIYVFSFTKNALSALLQAQEQAGHEKDAKKAWSKAVSVLLDLLPSLLSAGAEITKAVLF